MPSHFTDTTAMPTKFSAPFLLFLLTVVYRASADTSGCEWQHTADQCGSAPCTPDLPQQLTVGQGGGGGDADCSNGGWCASGSKFFCCPSSFVAKNCAWTGADGGTCLGECPAGQVQLTVDPAGDGKTCVIGCRAFCCDPPA